MNRTLVIPLLMLLMWLPVAALNAQQPDTSAEDPNTSAEQSENATDADTDTDTDTDTDLPDIDSQPIESSQSTGPGRFIPSEQISQDFGVSFPVDI